VLADDLEDDGDGAGGRRHALPPTRRSAHAYSLLLAHNRRFLVAAGAAAQRAADFDLARRLDVGDDVEAHVEEILVVAHEELLQ
jgi:hypothetical protein